MADCRDAFCDFCDVSMDLHGGPDTCHLAESKARLLEGAFR